MRKKAYLIGNSQNNALVRENIDSHWQEESECTIIFISFPPLTRMYDRVGQMAVHVFRPPLDTPAIHLFRLNNGTSKHCVNILGPIYRWLVDSQMCYCMSLESGTWAR